MSSVRSLPEPWSTVGDELRRRGLRWTPQRRTVIEVLAGTDGHLTGADLVERCRARDASTIPSTVYRTLDVLEELGLVRHGHDPNGREEFHVLPAAEHAHLYCRVCSGSWELTSADPVVVAAVDAVRAGHGFTIDVPHLTLTGVCAACRAAGDDA
jgi:Fur family ferric uptake transcriptional regulator